MEHLHNLKFCGNKVVFEFKSGIDHEISIIKRVAESGDYDKIKDICYDLRNKIHKRNKCIKLHTKPVRYSQWVFFENALDFRKWLLYLCMWEFCIILINVWCSVEVMNYIFDQYGMSRKLSFCMIAKSFFCIRHVICVLPTQSVFILVCDTCKNGRFTIVMTCMMSHIQTLIGRNNKIEQILT